MALSFNYCTLYIVHFQPQVSAKFKWFHFKFKGTFSLGCHNEFVCFGENALLVIIDL